MEQEAADGAFVERRDPQRKTLRDAFDALDHEWKGYVELNGMPMTAYMQLVELGLAEVKYNSATGMMYRRTR